MKKYKGSARVRVRRYGSGLSWAPLAAGIAIQLVLATNCSKVASALSLKCSGEATPEEKGESALPWSGTFRVDLLRGTWEGKIEMPSGQGLSARGTVGKSGELKGKLDSDVAGGEINAHWTGTTIAARVVQGAASFQASGSCAPDVDDVTGSIGEFSGATADPYPEKNVRAAGDILDPIKDARAFWCGLRNSRAFEVGSLGLLSAIEANCPGDFEIAAACTVGPPESNPPSPPTIAGALVNSVSRSLQQWPHITQSEPSLAVQRGNPGMVLAGFNDTTALWLAQPAQGQGGVGYAWSSDAARTFSQNPDQLALQLPTRPNAARSVSWADPTFAFRQGRFEAAALETTIYVFPPLVVIPIQGLMVAVSEFVNGSIWFRGAGVELNLPGAVPDKPWFTPATPGENGYGAFICFTAFRTSPKRSQIYLARVELPPPGSPPPTTITPQTVIPVSAELTEPDVLQGCQVATAPDGTVWLSWWEEVSGVSRIKGRMYDQSTGQLGPVFDASGPFLAPADAQASTECGRKALKGHIRHLPMPSMALDPVDGRIYLAYAAQDTNPPYNSRVVVARSTNAGASWTRWLVDDGGSGDRFMPALGVSNSRIVRVIWYDRRNDPDNVNIDVYADTGVGWSTDQRLTSASFGVPRLLPNFDCSDLSAPFRVADCYMGDYNAVTFGPQDQSSKPQFLHAWGDNSLKFFDPDTQLEVPDPDVRALIPSSPGC